MPAFSHLGTTGISGAKIENVQGHGGFSRFTIRVHRYYQA
jgi:hypothetical protein